MTSIYILLQWARPAWLLVLFAGAISVGMLIMVLSVLHGWIADQFFMLDDSDIMDMDDAEQDAQRPTSFEIPLNAQTSAW